MTTSHGTGTLTLRPRQRAPVEWPDKRDCGRADARHARSLKPSRYRAGGTP